MRRVLLPLLGGILLACNTGNRFNQGDLGYGDTGDGDSGSSGDGGSDGGGDAGISDGGTDGGGTDGGGSDGGGTDGGGTDTGPDYCHHDYHPLHETGWTKTYSAMFSFNGSASTSGTATETGYGLVTLPDGSEGYAYQDTVTISGGESHDVKTWVACDPPGDEGMYIVGWEGTYDFMGFLAYSVDATNTPGRMYLPPEYALGAVGSWDYSYTMNVMADSGKGPKSYSYTFTGTYAEAGMMDYTLFDGSTVNAYKLVNSYTRTDQFGTTNGYIEQWWAQGLGLVKELHLNMDTGETIASKELTGYTGLTPD